MACLLCVVFSFAWVKEESANLSDTYLNLYQKSIKEFKDKQLLLIGKIKSLSQLSSENIPALKSEIDSVRLQLKSVDFWLRYLDPILYKKINGPLPVEWETEVFEKFEKPYKRGGSGLALATLYLDEPNPQREFLLNLIVSSDQALGLYLTDSVAKPLLLPDHFYFANRLFLLNLAAIYTTGFECPNPERVIPELEEMLKATSQIYAAYNHQFPSKALTQEYLTLYKQLVVFVSNEPKDPNLFNHFVMIRDFVNPLFAINQQLIKTNRVISRSFNDYSLNSNSPSIFNKNLYSGQNRKGIYIAINNPAQLQEIKDIGKLLFFDPILSGNGKRSCASCHKSSMYFTDTTQNTSFDFSNTEKLPRNTPSLVNVVYNHLLMVDGKHTTLQQQALAVTTNPKEMGNSPSKLMEQVMSCKDYKKAFTKFRKLTPNYPEITLDHIFSAITLYYGGFSDYEAPFDKAMNKQETMDENVVKGFNVFMSKAQCATCHFVPQFNGVKPPYIGSEFEVLGVPSDLSYHNLSLDSGRFMVHSAPETFRAFRTGSIRNAVYTKPYMHNGVFQTLEEVLEFYNAGGGAARGLPIENQTLSADSLHLTKEEKFALMAFMKSLNEEIPKETPPIKLPESNLKPFANRTVGGDY